MLPSTLSSTPMVAVLPGTQVLGTTGAVSAMAGAAGAGGGLTGSSRDSRPRCHHSRGGCGGAGRRFRRWGDDGCRARDCPHGGRDRRGRCDRSGRRERGLHQAGRRRRQLHLRRGLRAWERGCDDGRRRRHDRGRLCQGCGRLCQGGLRLGPTKRANGQRQSGSDAKAHYFAGALERAAGLPRVPPLCGLPLTGMRKHRRTGRRICRCSSCRPWRR